MPLAEFNYCIEQIDVPPKLPMILRQFCKAAIRTQPYDLLKWSCAYFRALADGEEPPMKLRLEYPVACTCFGLTIGFLKVLMRRLGADYNKELCLEWILDRWDQLCLDRRDSDLIVQIGRFRYQCQMKKFLAIAVGIIARTLTETMCFVCELFTHEPDGGSAMIPIGLFMEIYGYLAHLKCDGSEMELCFCTAESEKSSEKEVTPVPSPVTEPIADLDLEAPTEVQPDLKIADWQSFQSFGDEYGEGSFYHGGEASYSSFDHPLSPRSIRSMEQVEVKQEEEIPMESETTQEVPQQVESDESKKSVSKESTEKSMSAQFYPDVPGIGRRLGPDEITAVGVWMSECARRQGGMVGPRNIRHINCPPLEGCRAPAPPRNQEDYFLISNF